MKKISEMNNSEILRTVLDALRKIDKNNEIKNIENDGRELTLTLNHDEELQSCPIINIKVTTGYTDPE